MLGGSRRSVVEGDYRGPKASQPAIRKSSAIVVLGFAALILVGTLLLLLPASTRSGAVPPLSLALFTATSAVCVTGLVVVDTGTYWSGFGQTVILLLIQIGGIGFGASATLLFWLIGRNISLSDRIKLAAMVPVTAVSSFARVSLYIIGVSLGLQLAGALVLFVSWIERYPANTAAVLAIFHSVSAFCNAGFDIFGSVGAPGTSLALDRHNPVVTIVITLLVLIGGLGFPVLIELLRRWRRPQGRSNSKHSTVSARSARSIRVSLSLHARLVLVTHLGLFVLSVLLFWVIEGGNPVTLGGEETGKQLIDVVNMAAQPRTAGYATITPLSLAPAGLILTIFLMFVGTASAGTGGGAKVNTVATIFASVAATVSGRPRPELFKRSLTQESVNKGLAVVIIMLATIGTATLLLSLTEPGIAAEHLLFEVVSAFSTVGLSLDVTPRLSEAGRIIVEILMFAGRLGPLTLVVLLTARKEPPNVTYA